ncbi:MAG: phosphoribosyltransferase family protein [Chloroflexi bacterium]|nr:phosphoribosyltransferase family protein [Chloroflexota bacterium]
MSEPSGPAWTPQGEEPSNFWLARALWDSGGIMFGDFDLGATLGSPVYINVRRLIAHPWALRRIGDLLSDETRMLGGMLRPTIAPFELIAGVPMGGLHAATAFSLSSNVPMIYVHPPSQAHAAEEIEGTYYPGQTVILVDDLMTRGGSLAETADLLRSAGLMVHDAFVLIDRGAGGVERMRREGVKVHSLLTLEGLLNYLLARELITEAVYAKCLTWLEGVRGDER